MKRFLAVLLVLVMVITVVTSVAEVDLSGYSTEELYALERKVGQEILNRVMPDGVFYEDDEVALKWIGLKDTLGMYFGPNILVTNKTDHDIYFDIATMAINGIKTSVYSSMYSTSMIEPGLSVLTGANDLAIVQTSSFKDIGINGIKDIDTVYLTIQFFDSKDYNQKIIKEVTQTIPIVK